MSGMMKIGGMAFGLVVAMGVLVALAQTAEKVPTELYVRTIPSGAAITVDGRKQGDSPKLFEIEPGEHTVVVELPGHRPKAKTVTVRDGRIKRVILELRQRPDGNADESTGGRPVEEANVLANWSFEDGASQQRWPIQTGIWSGNWSQVVGAERGIKPRTGSKMLRFDCTSWGVPGICPNSQVSQIIDLSDRINDVREGQLKVRATARFNRVAGNDKSDTRFRIVLIAYRGRVHDNFQNYEHGRHIFAKAGPLDTDADPTTWQWASTEMLVPRETDYLVVDLIAEENVSNETSGKEFDGHYADDVVVTLETIGSPHSDSEPDNTASGPDAAAKRFLEAVVARDIELMQELIDPMPPRWTAEKMPEFVSEIRDGVFADVPEKLTEIREAVVKDGWAAVRIDGPKQFKGKYLWLALRQTRDGWRVCFADDARPGEKLEKHLEDFVSRRGDDRPVTTIDVGNTDAATVPREPAQQAWGEPVEGVQMRVTDDRLIMPEGGTIDLRVDLRNRGEKDRRIELEHEAWLLEIDGKWHSPNGGASGDRREMPLAMGQTQRNVQVWDWLWESIKEEIRRLSPGTYRLRVARRIPYHGPGAIRVVSNPVELVVKATDPLSDIPGTLKRRGWKLQRDDQGHIVTAIWSASASSGATGTADDTSEGPADTHGGEGDPSRSKEVVSWMEEDLAIMAGLPHLKSLVIERAELSTTAYQRLAHLQQLEELRFFGGNVDDEGLALLARLRGLRHLALSRTKITDVGLKHLLPLTNLRWLSAYGTKVSDAGLVHLRGLAKLEELYLGETQVTDAGLAHLKPIERLKVLYLHDDAITDDGLRTLGAMRSLETLSLIDTPVTNAGLEHLKKLPNLRSIAVRGSKVTTGGIGRFLEARPGCKTDVKYFSDEQKGPAASTSGGDSAEPAEISPRKVFSARHEAGILAVAYAPDGRWLATVDQQGKLTLCDTDTGRQRWARPVLTDEEKEPLLYEDRRGRINTASVAFSPDGYTLAVAANPVVRLYDTASGRLLRALKDEGLIDALKSLDRPPATVSRELELLKTIPHAHGRVYSVAFSADGKTLATSGSHLIRADGSSIVGSQEATPGKLKLWDVERGLLVRDMGEYHGPVRSLVVSADGKTAASIGSPPPMGTASVRLWDPQTGDVTDAIHFNRTAYRTGALALSPFGNVLAVGLIHTEVEEVGPLGRVEQLSGNRTCRLMVWKSRSRRELDRVLNHETPGLVTSLGFSADGRLMAVGMDRRGIEIWDSRTLTQVGEIPVPKDSDEDVCLTFSPTDNRLAIAGNGEEQGALAIWDLGPRGK